MRFASIAAAVGVIALAACGPSTGTGSRACERARVEGREAADRLEAAMQANAPLGGHVEAVERANVEMNRACELGIIEPPATPAPPQTRPAEVAETPLGPNTYFVNVEVTDERTAPGGGVVENRIYRGQSVEVTDRQGEWFRVTGLQYTPRWVRASHLSRERPAPLPQLTLAPDLMDSRIQGIPGVGEDGHSEADVTALRTGAAHLLASGQCRAIEIGSKSVNRAGVYWVNCGEGQNRFFTMGGGEPQFCGRSASSC
ncbi:MAG: hypothetical protein GC206_15890 [Alphaproteobacteria bacterium]|nr:hypothetical protein [Alphaproteobacteria bacterium]